MRTSRLLIGAALLMVLDTAGTFLLEPSEHERDRDPVVVTTIAREAHDTWHVDFVAPATCGVNEACDVTFRLVPIDGWRANRQFPTKLWIDQNALVSLTTRAIDLKEDGTADVHLTMIPRAAGTHAVAARLRVSACNEEICRVGKHDIALVVRARS